MQSSYGSKLLTDLKVKLSSSHVLAKDDKLYPLTELYSPMFLSMHNIDKSVVPLLAFEENLPKALQKWLGIKQELYLPCIMKLLEAVDKKENLGEKVTLTFFETILEQLRLKNKDEIKKYTLKLLSNENKLTFAKDLYYFEEEDAVCLADSYYLKRIHEMSHNDTLELAKLCGVNLLPFSQEVNYGGQTPVLDESLRNFYLERLPFIVLQVSKELYEFPSIVLKKLFYKVNSIELYKCQNILITYPFNKPVEIETQHYFDLLKIYVVGNWKNLRTVIHEHIKEKLKLKSDISKILDLESVAEEDKKTWLRYHKGEPQKLQEIEEELNKLLSGEEIDYTEIDNDDDFIDNSTNFQLSSEEDVDIEQIITATVNKSADSRNQCMNSDDLLVKQGVGNRQVKKTTVRKSITSVSKKISNIDPSNDLDFVSAEVPTAIVSVCSKSEAIVKQDASFEQAKIAKNDECANLKSNTTHLLKNGSFELEKPTYDNTLKEFYLERLPFIVQWESRKQKHKPKKILKNLYNKIASIELYQCSDIHIQYPYTYPTDTSCFFDDLKIYVVGKWCDQKIKIHQYIKENIGLHIDVIDIINVEPISQIVAKERTFHEEDYPQKLHQIEEAIKMIVSAEEVLATELQLANDEEYSKDTESLENKEFVAETLPSGKSDDNCDFQPHSSNLYYRIVTQIVEGNIPLEKDEPQQLHETEQEIKTLAAAEEISNELQVASYEKYSTDDMLNKELTAEASLKENSNVNFIKPCSSRPYYSVKFKGSKVHIIFPEITGIVEQYTSTSDQLQDDAIKVNVKITPKMPLTYDRAQKSPIPKSHSLTNFQVEPEILLHDVTYDETHLKRLGEKYVFIFLQDYYKNKYPEAQINSEHAHFTLQYQSHVIEIIWINGNEDKQLEYDLLLKKNEEFKQYIKVKSVNIAKINLIHSVFTGISKSTVEHLEYNAKYCIYCILYDDTSPISVPEEGMMNVNALYKIVPQKIPSV